ELTIAALLIAWTIAIPAGVVAAWRRRTAVDYSASAAALTGLSIPNFWLGIMLIYLFAVHLRWLPASGFVPLSQDPALNVETIFALPGLGRLAVESIYGRDYPMLEGVVMFSALAVLAINLAVDIVYSLIDPRIKLAGSGA